MKVKIEESWCRQLQEEFDKSYFERLVAFVHEEYARARVLPKGSQIFHIFDACPFEKVKVVILGQDPYPTPGQYYGVCFSGARRCGDTAFFGKYFPGDSSGFGKACTGFGQSRPLGRTRSFFHEFGTYREGL